MRDVEKTEHDPGRPITGFVRYVYVYLPQAAVHHLRRIPRVLVDPRLQGKRRHHLPLPR